MGGWFRKEIKSIADLKGLRFRIGGYAGKVLARLGALPQQLAGGDLYAALDKGSIDAAEWVGPYDDEKLGLNKVARYYYYPGWWEGGTEVALLVNLKAYSALPVEYKAALDVACYEATLDMVSKYDALNPGALRRLVATGTELRPFARELLEACFKAANDQYDEDVSGNANFRKVFEPWKKFRDEEVLWFRVAEGSFDNFMMSMNARQINAKK
jgi:TRAP-type mannitol/chloroaromatic compound transport system substrate-binding protein